jgi:hypothetical protein
MNLELLFVIICGIYSVVYLVIRTYTDIVNILGTKYTETFINRGKYIKAYIKSYIWFICTTIVVYYICNGYKLIN